MIDFRVLAYRGRLMTVLSGATSTDSLFSNLGVHSILNDLENFDLGDDDADYRRESLGRIDEA